MASYIADVYTLDQLGHADVETSKSYDASDDGSAEAGARSWCATVAPMTENATYGRFSLDGIVVRSWSHKASVKNG
jgi:hypothetical protein